MSAAPAMRLDQLLAGFGDPRASAGLVVAGLELDSRRVQPGMAFVALAGGHAHGLDYAGQAAARGAAAILAEAAPGRDMPAQVAGVPVLEVAQLGRQLGHIAARFHGEPSRALQVIGVTGTNGKTTTVQLLVQALGRAGFRAASIGTLGAGFDGALEPGERTTPDAIELQRLLAGFRAAGASHVAMEVSSHALVQGRVNGVHFAQAVFTNLSRDHLDYHGSMEAYGQAKARLFAWPGLGAAIINADDAFGRRLAADVRGVSLLRHGIERDDVEVAAAAVELADDGVAFELRTPWGSAPMRSALLGRFNVSNLLAVAACLGQLGLPLATIAAALGAVHPVAGRMQRLGGGAKPLVVVDYAHTPDALAQALDALRAHCRGRLACVFGCGGERDRGKRPEMGAIAEARADAVFVTDDNPRSEDGDAIVDAILAGMRAPTDATRERDRAAAISLAIALARPGDVVLVAGKGHEPYQEVAGARQPFDDRAVAARALELWR